MGKPNKDNYSARLPWLVRQASESKLFCLFIFLLQAHCSSSLTSSSFSASLQSSPNFPRVRFCDSALCSSSRSLRGPFMVQTWSCPVTHATNGSTELLGGRLMGFTCTRVRAWPPLSLGFTLLAHCSPPATCFAQPLAPQPPVPSHGRSCSSCSPFRYWFKHWFFE